jgi:glyoxylase-like metal-dependent hydrolase (beta-lactamase superfamily II)
MYNRPAWDRDEDPQSTTRLLGGHVFIETVPVGITQTNCYVVGCEESGEGLVIDPGGDGDAILCVIERAALSVQIVVNTHGHFDHIGANGEVVRATGARLAIHPGDAPMLRLGGGAALFGLPVQPSPEADLKLFHGQVIRVGELSLEVLHTPGHSPGGVSLYLEAQGVAFDGDLLFAGGVGRTDLPGGSWETLERSIREVLFALPDETVLYPGHGPATTVGRERRSNPWLN